MCPHIPDDPYGRTVDYPADVDTAWQRLRRVVAGQPTPVLEALRDTAEQWVGSAEGDGAPHCVVCDHATLVLCELAALLDTVMEERERHVARTVDTLGRTG